MPASDIDPGLPYLFVHIVGLVLIAHACRKYIEAKRSPVRWNRPRLSPTFWCWIDFHTVERPPNSGLFGYLFLVHHCNSMVVESRWVASGRIWPGMWDFCHISSPLNGQFVVSQPTIQSGHYITMDHSNEWEAVHWWRPESCGRYPFSYRSRSWGMRPSDILGDYTEKT